MKGFYVLGACALVFVLISVWTNNGGFFAASVVEACGALVCRVLASSQKGG